MTSTHSSFINSAYSFQAENLNLQVPLNVVLTRTTPIYTFMYFVSPCLQLFELYLFCYSYSTEQLNNYFNLYFFINCTLFSLAEAFSQTIFNFVVHFIDESRIETAKIHFLYSIILKYITITLLGLIFSVVKLPFLSQETNSLKPIFIIMQIFGDLSLEDILNLKLALGQKIHFYLIQMVKYSTKFTFLTFYFLVFNSYDLKLFILISNAPSVILNLVLLLSLFLSFERQFQLSVQILTPFRIKLFLVVLIKTFLSFQLQFDFPLQIYLIYIFPLIKGSSGSSIFQFSVITGYHMYMLSKAIINGFSVVGIRYIPLQEGTRKMQKYIKTAFISAAITIFSFSFVLMLFSPPFCTFLNVLNAKEIEINISMKWIEKSGQIVLSSCFSSVYYILLNWLKVMKYQNLAIGLTIFNLVFVTLMLISLFFSNKYTNPMEVVVLSSLLKLISSILVLINLLFKIGATKADEEVKEIQQNNIDNNQDNLPSSHEIDRNVSQAVTIFAERTSEHQSEILISQTLNSSVKKGSLIPATQQGGSRSTLFDESDQTLSFKVKKEQ